jgi:hypothetical protein
LVGGPISEAADGLRELNVELIRARSPQVKGRIERDFGTAQDRLIKEMRVEGISTIEEANRFLESYWIPFWNQRFAVEPSERKDRHRPLPKRARLETLFAETWTRIVGADFTFRFKNRRYQIQKGEARGIRPNDRITIEVHVDGSTVFRWKSRYLSPEVIAAYNAEPSHVQGPRRPRPKTPLPAPHSNGRKPKSPNPNAKTRSSRPTPDHPWRNSKIGRGSRDYTPGKVNVTST